MVRNLSILMMLLFFFKGEAQLKNQKHMEHKKGESVAVLAGGCFWCMEAVYQDLIGVKEVKSGYTGGILANPTYEQVCTGNTNHAEAVRITFDENQISYEELLEVFWHIHDPTTLNRQGEDVGTQYRSEIFYLDEYQKDIAEKSKEKFEHSGLWQGAFTTKIEPLKVFYPAESYHDDYFRRNPKNPYCNAVVGPKVQKFREKFRNKLKK